MYEKEKSTRDSSTYLLSYVNMISLMQFFIRAEKKSAEKESHWSRVTARKTSAIYFRLFIRRVCASMPRGSAKSNEKSPSNVCENLQQYCLNSSLHGLRYIGTTTLSAFERIFFGMSFMLVIVLAAYFISNIWQKWNESPVIVSGNPITTNIKDIPFPAVTICNMNQVKRNFAESLQLRRDKVILDSICTQGDQLNDSAENFEGKWSFVREFLLNASQPCHQMMKMCKFGMRNMSCDKIFTSALTDEGLCCTFNAVHPMLMFKNFNEENYIDRDLFDLSYSTWNPEDGYEESNEKLPYPRPVPGN
jgi:acid-sensing ion channel, other